MIVKALLVSTGALAFATIACGEVAVLGSVEYDPVIEYKKGRLQSCGLHFSATAVGPFTGAFGVQGSFNHVHYEGELPFYLVKAVLYAPDPNGEGLSIAPVSHLTVIAGGVSTEGATQMEGEVPNTRLIVFEYLDNFDDIMRFDNGLWSGATIAMSTSDDKNDLSLTLDAVSFQDDLILDLSNCTVNLMQQAADEMRPLIEP